MVIKGSGSNKRVFYDSEKVFVPIDNYIYFHHIEKYITLPSYPDNVSDSMGISMPSQSILGRSAPLYTYSNSGPRTVSFNLTVHRDMLRLVNLTNSTIKSDDYINELINMLQAAAVPEYSDPAKMINPPVVSLRIGDEIYIHGVVTGSVNVTHGGNGSPILKTVSGLKYALASTTFTISEFYPYSASQIAQLGSFRGFNETLDRLVYNGELATKAVSTTAARNSVNVQRAVMRMTK